MQRGNESNEALRRQQTAGSTEAEGDGQFAAKVNGSFTYNYNLQDLASLFTENINLEVYLAYKLHVLGQF